MKTFFLWFIGLPIALFLAALVIGVSVSFYNARQNSPTFDPVTFDLSGNQPDGTSKKNPECIFYVPTRYWGDFSVGYKKRKDDFFTLTFDLSNFDTLEKEKMKDSVRVLVTRSVGYNKQIAWYLKEINSRAPDEVSLGMKIFNGKVAGTWDQYIYYFFKGFDNEDVVVQSIPALHGPGIFRAFRKINSSIEIRFSFTPRELSEIPEIDKKVTSYIRSLQIPPASFTRLK